MSKRSFSLLFAKRLDSAQGGTLRLVNHHRNIKNFTYATYWNDFTHYSIYNTKDSQSSGKEYRVAERMREAGGKEENL